MFLEINTVRKVDGPRPYMLESRDLADSWAIYISSDHRDMPIFLGTCPVDADPAALLREVRETFPSIPLRSEAADLTGIDLGDEAVDATERKLFEVDMPDADGGSYIVCAATPIEAFNVYAYNVIDGQISAFFDDGADTRMVARDITQPVNETRVVDWGDVEQISMTAADIPVVKAAIEMNYDFELEGFDIEDVSDDGPSF